MPTTYAEISWTGEVTPKDVLGVAKLIFGYWGEPVLDPAENFLCVKTRYKGVDKNVSLVAASIKNLGARTVSISITNEYHWGTLQ